MAKKKRTEQSSTEELAELGLLDTALDSKLRIYLNKLELGDSAALNDAIEFCVEHQLFERDDLTLDVRQLVESVRENAARPHKVSRKRIPKGKPTRDAKGRPATPHVHLQRYEQVETHLEDAAKAGVRTTVSAACRAVGGTQHDAFRKSYMKVVRGNLFAGYYEPDYVAPDDNLK